jgi:hypothetical protein
LTANFTPSDTLDYKTATQTVSLTVNAASTTPSPSFTLSLNISTLTLHPGQSGTVQAIFTPQNGFQGTVTLTCAGLPQMTSCAFQPKTLTANGTNTSQTATVTLAALSFSDLSSQVEQPTHSALAGFWLLPAGLLGGWLFWQRRKLQAAAKYIWIVVLLLSCTIGMMGCGVNFTPTLPGSGAITIAATAENGMTQTQTLVLNVTKPQ